MWFVGGFSILFEVILHLFFGCFCYIFRVFFSLFLRRVCFFVLFGALYGVPFLGGNWVFFGFLLDLLS